MHSDSDAVLIVVQTAKEDARVVFPTRLLSLSSKLQQWCQAQATGGADGDTEAKMAEIVVNLPYIGDQCSAQRVFSDIVDFSEYYRNTPFEELQMPLDGVFADRVGDWYVQLMARCEASGLLIALVRTAHFLQIEPLIDLISAYMASNISDNPDKLEKMFLLTPCFSEEDVTCVSTQLTL